MLEYLPTPIVVYLCVVMAGFGLIMGSALNCLALRLVSGKKWSGKARSACPACGHVLSALDLVPLFSWLFLRGKCRYCKAPVSIRYPLTEALLAAVYVALLLKYDLSLSLITPVIFASCLFCLSLVDLDTQIIPDRFILIPIIARSAELLLTSGFRGLLTGALPGLIIAGSVLIISLIMDKVLGKETMGGGDIKLLFVIGLFLPLGQCLLMVMIACVVGIVMASLLMKVSPETPFPFGPALSLAAIVTMFIGEPVLNWYIGLF
jgi:leader peptidase (prepilin peptidase)/N-methyltransferase